MGCKPSKKGESSTPMIEEPDIAQSHIPQLHSYDHQKRYIMDPGTGSIISPMRETSKPFSQSFSVLLFFDKLGDGESEISMDSVSDSDYEE